MKNMKSSGYLMSLYLITALCCISIFSAIPVYAQYPAGSPVAINGKLKVTGSQLTNECGNPVQLRGMSTHGVQWFPGCYTTTSLNALTNNWGIDVFRIAIYVQEGGYVNNPSYWKTWIDNMVMECGNRGIYCMIDWHVLNPGDPNANINEARDFWSYMSAKHTGKKHVLYEICNEPNGVSWPTVKTYANDIIPRIRANDPSTIIIVGTPTWSQDVDIASTDKLNYTNIMYALHFYSGTHTGYLRDKANTAITNGAALFVTECGTSTASGDGGPYLTEMQTWIDWMAANKVSWINWNYADKNETSSALSPGACGISGWNNTSASGTFIKQKILSPADNFVCGGTNNPPAVTITYPASGATYTAPASITINATASDADGTVNAVAFYNRNTLLETDNTSPYSFTWSGVSAGAYSLTARATDNGGAVTTSAAVSVTVTGGTVTTGLKVQYKTTDANATTNTLRPLFQIINTGSTAVPLSELRIRYWYTREGTAAQNFYCDWSAIGCGNIRASFVNLSGTVSGANNYLEISFTSGSIGANSSSGEIQDRIAKSDWTNYTQTGDYSLDGSKTSYTDWNKVTLYRNSVLVWGTEPAGYTTAAPLVSSEKVEESDIRTGKLFISPNPSGYYADVYYSSAIQQKTTIIVSNTTSAKQIEINQVMQTGLNKVRVNLSALSSGTYFITVVPLKGKPLIKKMVVAK